MTRPEYIPLVSSSQNWDGPLQNNLLNLFNFPAGFPEGDGVAFDETDLGTFPAGSYDRCSYWVNHTTLGWVRYQSDGTAWIIRERLVPPTIVDSVGATTADLKVNELLASLREVGIIL